MMPGDGSAESQHVLPKPKFSFQVKWDSEVISFQEVSGLDTETQLIKHPAKDSPELGVFKVHGFEKSSGTVTLRKGVFMSDTKVSDSYGKAKMNTTRRASVTISLLDAAGSPMMVWTLLNAWPTKITGTSLGSDGNEAAIEIIEVAYEGLIIDNG